MTAPSPRALMPSLHLTAIPPSQACLWERPQVPKGAQKLPRTAPKIVRKIVPHRKTVLKWENSWDMGQMWRGM